MVIHRRVVPHSSDNGLMPDWLALPDKNLKPANVKDWDEKHGGEGAGDNWAGMGNTDGGTLR